MKRNLLAATLLLLVCSPVLGQISTEEEPVSFRMNIPTLTRSEKAQKTLPLLDMKKLEQEDREDEVNGIPPRFGFPHRVSYNLENSGEWTTLPDGNRMWRLVISCPNALSINLLYDKFWLPDGAKLFIYSNDRKHSIGAFTSANNTGEEKDMQEFATGLVYGDQVTLEYYLPRGVKETGVVSIAHVVHGYRFIYLSDNATRSYGDSQSCNININCPPGQDWQNEKNAVAMILIDGIRACTGSLINTTANDNRPLFLTADHCLSGTDVIGRTNLSHWSFYWHYESPDCTNAQPAVIRSTSGATLVANNSVSDFALLLLTEDPRDKTGVTPYYLGWDRSGNAGTSGVGIHHPRGDIKKISQAHKIVNNPNQISWSFGTTTLLPNMHWRAVFSSGLIEHGSSGSPLINNNRQVIGQLQGSKNRAICNTAYSMMYGKLSVSWTGNNATDSRRRLRDWLDPKNTGVSTLNGIGEVACVSTFTNKTVRSSQTVTGCSTLSLQNVTVTGNATLTLNASGHVSINGTFEVHSGSALNIQ